MIIENMVIVCSIVYKEVEVQYPVCTYSYFKTDLSTVVMPI